MLIRPGDSISVFDNKLGLFVPCEILITFPMIVDDPMNYGCPRFANYIIYTDGTQDEQGCTRVYASTYDPNSDHPEFYPIQTEAEWEKIEQILDDAMQQVHNPEFYPIQTETEWDTLEQTLDGTMQEVEEMFVLPDLPSEPPDPDLPFS